MANQTVNVNPTDAVVGSTTDAAPANDTAAAGLNGRLQRIAQRLTSLIGLLPGALVGGRLDVNVGAAATLTVQEDSNSLLQNAIARTIGRAFANVAASSTDSSLVAAQGASTKIRVLAVAAVAGATATNLTFNTKPAGAGSAISPLLANGINGGEVLPYNPKGWFETNANEGLTVTTGAGSTTGILVTWIPAT